MKAAARAGKLVEHSEEFEYTRFREDYRSIPRGTVCIADGTVIRGFPHIPRIFTIGKGLERNMTVPFYIEEKIDGFNLRVALVGKEIWAFSRGGFVDLFATEKVREMELEDFFMEYPSYTLCGEMIGNTPYTPPTDDFDVRWFVFDIDDGERYLPCREKYSILKEHGIRSVPLCGRFSTASEAAQVALRVLKQKGEGIVIKSEDRLKVVKFIVPFADIEDIHHNIGLFADMPSGFFLQRLLRSALFVSDFGLNRKAYAHLLGEALYDGFAEAFHRMKEDGEVSEEFEIRIRNPAAWERIVAHAGKEIKIQKLWERMEKGCRRIRFKKIYLRSTKILRECLAGKAQID